MPALAMHIYAYIEACLPPQVVDRVEVGHVQQVLVELDAARLLLFDDAEERDARVAREQAAYRLGRALARRDGRLVAVRTARVAHALLGETQGARDPAARLVLDVCVHDDLGEAVRPLEALRAARAVAGCVAGAVLRLPRELCVCEAEVATDDEERDERCGARTTRAGERSPRGQRHGLSPDGGNSIARCRTQQTQCKGTGCTLSSGATRPAEQPGQAGHADHFVNRLRCPGPLMTPSAGMPDDLAGVEAN